MRPEPRSATNTTGTTAGANGGFRWNSPLPYLFGGLALMLALIAVVLVIIACSDRKPSGRRSDDDDYDDDNSNGDDEEEEEHTCSECASKKVIDNELKILVIMAGDFNPTFLAKPVAKPPSPDGMK